VAEGIETPPQRDHLIDLGCKLGQGYLFSPAVPADQLDPLATLIRVH
jgi:EAL domain-containing protein (putative c-di-GMP-specific phosphodiesterase class I)